MIGQSDGVSPQALIRHRDNHMRNAGAGGHLHPPRWSSLSLGARQGARCANCGDTSWWQVNGGMGGCVRCWTPMLTGGRKRYFGT